MGSLHAVSDGSFTPSSSPDVMHPRDWVMAQTGLSAAMRDALSVLVAAYGGLQQKNGEFFVLESRVDPHLRTGFRTFKNYLSKLRKLGLLEMLSRGPNQYGPKTRWRMRLDVFCQSAQMSMNLPVTYETPEELNDGGRRGVSHGTEVHKQQVHSQQAHGQHYHFKNSGARDDCD